MTLHKHPVDPKPQFYPDGNGPILLSDGGNFVEMEPGFEIAPCDADGIAVCNSHSWGSDQLVFAGGTVAWTAWGIVIGKQRPGEPQSFKSKKTCRSNVTT
jgi:hypothetical protein